MSRRTPFHAVLLLAGLSATYAHAQSAPAGSCLLPSGDWCWPIAPLTYGEACECRLPDGRVVIGIVQ